MEWIKKWWILVLAILLIAGDLYFSIYLNVGDKNETLKVIQFLLNNLTLIALLLYVIYTKDLAVSAQQTAAANIKIVEAMENRLLEQWACELKDAPCLTIDGEDVSRLVHIEDKHLTAEIYNSYLSKGKVRTLIFKPLNCGSRTVILHNVKFQISATRGGRPREIIYIPRTPIVINRDQEREICVAYNVEGEMEISVREISYQDGDKKLNQWTANPFKEPERYQELQGSSPD